MTRSAPAAASRASPLSPDGRRIAIHPLDVHGRFIRARRVTFAVLVALYLAAPLVHIGGHPAIHLDVDERRFYLFGATFNAQDTWILLFLLVAGAFSLLFLTAWRGRAWCGWACPQTVFLEGFYRPIERLLDGPRNRRLGRIGTPWTAGRVARAALKHGLFAAISLALAHVAVSLFTSAAELAGMVREGPTTHVVAFTWTMATSAVLYFDFAWFREQLCVVVCPYGRLQSALHDDDSIVIGYDAGRGEPRGPIHHHATGARASGDCIDCKKCVWACPTAIDIRNGFQMECVACAQCIDVCDEVMDKVGRRRGLIRYASINTFANKPTRVARPRLALYLALMLVSGSGAALALGARTPFEANIVRAPGVPWVLDDGRVRNQVDIHLVNKHAAPARFHIAARSPIAAEVRLGQDHIELPSLGHARIPLVVGFDRSAAHHGDTLDVTITDEGTGTVRHRELRLLAPGL